MYIPVHLISPNETGEYLRKQFWVHVKPTDIGGYNCFEYQSDVYNITSIRDQDNIVHNHAYKDVPGLGQVHLHWYWDGDGDIVFAWANKRVGNDDCKKSGTWLWLR